MDIALAQKNRAGGSTSALPSVSCTFTEPNVAGRLLVAIARLDDDTTTKIPVISDSLGNTWSQVVTHRSASTPRLSIWCAPNCKAGLNTVTMTPPVDSNGQLLFIFEYRGSLETSPADGSNSWSGVLAGGADACTSGNIVTTRDADLVIACLMETTGAGSYGTVAPGTGFTQLDQADCGPGTYGRCTVEHKVVGNAGTYAGTFTHTVSFPNGMVVAAAFKRMQLTDELAPTFPATPVLDSATRADENPATGWTYPFWTGNASLKIASNNLTSVLGTGSGVLSRGPFGNNSEVHAKCNAAGGGFELYLCASGTGQGNNNLITTYFLNYGIAGANLLRVYKWNLGVITVLGADIAQTFTAGDSLGLRRVGTTLEVWYKVGSGLWKRIATRTDASFVNGGKLGAVMSATTNIANFGGGSYGDNLVDRAWPITLGSVGASLNDQATFKEYTFDDKTVRKDWK
jgi:hypothetical protein